MTIQQFCEAVYSYCLATNASVTSWVRSRHRNTMVGGKPTSRHLTGWAMDVIYDPGKMPSEETAQGIAKKLGLFVWREKDHDHLREML